MPAVAVNFVIDGLRGSAVAAAKHKYGCRVLEGLIAHCVQEQTKELSEELLTCVEQLALHAFGNFVLQQVLEHGAPQHRQCILETLLPKLPQFAMHRYASH